jgi:hypothetical protein
MGGYYIMNTLLLVFIIKANRILHKKNKAIPVTGCEGP